MRLAEPIKILVKEFASPIDSDAPVAENLPVESVFVLVSLIERSSFMRG